MPASALCGKSKQSGEAIICCWEKTFREKEKAEGEQKQGASARRRELDLLSVRKRACFFSLFSRTLPVSLVLLAFQK